MQVANDVASANELPSREARPGRRVSNSAAGKLQGGELRKDCVEGALERGLAGGERGVRGVRGQQRRVGLGALERRDAGVPASKLRCDEGLGPSRAFAILVSTSSGVSNPSTVESRAASALASAARAASRARRAECRWPTAGRTRSGRWRPPCRPEMEASRLASSEASAAADTTQESVGHLGVDLQRRDPCCDVEELLVHHHLEAAVGCHRDKRGVVGRGDGAVHGRRGAVVRQLQVHAVGGALRRHHALQHVEGRLVCLVGETRGQRALQRCDAAAVRGHLPVAAVARGAIAGASALLSSFDASSAVTRSSRDWMAAALLPEAAVFTARSVT